MQERFVMYSIVKGITLVASVVSMVEAKDKITNIVILSLAFSCVFALQYILTLQEKYVYNLIINIPVCFLGFVTFPESFLPLIVVFLAEEIDYFVIRQQYYLLLACIVSLLFLIVTPSYFNGLFCIIIVSFLCYTRYLVFRELSFKKTIHSQKEDLSLLEEKIKDNKRFIKTLRYTAALEERNRLAARLHDKVGHGISGSIIMFEASMMILDKDGAKAKEGMEKAILNLREGVDDIRAALKDERPIRSELGRNEILVKLEQFKTNYGITTNLVEQGNLDNIDISIWHCIHDNLEEALTNLLKHSNATLFVLTLKSMNKVLVVEYQDNGTKEMKKEDFSHIDNGQVDVMKKLVTKGIGLETMEERTIKNGGKFFIEQTGMGFLVKNIFLG